MIKYYTTILFASILLWCNAQNVTMVNYTAQNGLPSSQVYDIIQDKYGYLWFSTDKGLSRYNGYEFENFTKNDGLSDNVVFDFLKMPNGDIWCSTNTTELFSIRGREPKFTAYPFNNVILEDRVRQVTKSYYFSPEGELFMSFHHSFGYIHISKDGKKLYDVQRMDSDQPTNPKSMVLIDDSSEPFFFNDFEGSSRIKAPLLNFDSTELEPNSNKKNEGLHFEKRKVSVFVDRTEMTINHDGHKAKFAQLKGTVIAAGKHGDNLFWLGYSFGGIDIFNLKGERQRSLLPNKSVTQIYIDHEGNTWISTLNSGVYQIKNECIKSMTPAHEDDLPVSCLQIDGGQTLYIGYNNGNISSLSSSNNLHSFYQPKERFPARIGYDAVNDITYFSSDRIYSKSNTLFLNAGTNYLQPYGKGVFIGIGCAFLVRGNEVIDTLFETARSTDLVNYNNLIYSCNINGLHWEDFEGQNGRTYHGFSDTRIDDLNIIGNKLVLGTNGHGVMIINKNHKILHRIRNVDGLTSDFVSKTYTQNDSTLWVCTNHGFNRITFKENGSYRIDKMNSDDGLLSDEIWDLAILNDTIWVGTQLGLNYVAITDFNTTQKSQEHYFLSWMKILVNSDRIGLSNNTFSYDQNKIEFYFQGISFKAKNGLGYRYKLEGLTDSWTYSNNQNIIYSSLPVGLYNFIVQTKGENEDWESNELNFPFTISPPYWKTWWFRTSIIAFIAVLIYLFFKYRIFSYNRDIVREILRQILKRLRKSPPSIQIKYNGNEVVIKTASIHFIKTSANYLEIHTDDKMYLIRSSIDTFLTDLPDPLEFLRIHRSYVIRLDKIEQKGKKVLVINDHEIPVGRKYWVEMDKIQL